MASAIKQNLTSICLAACVGLGAAQLTARTVHAAAAPSADIAALQQAAQSASTPAAQARAQAALAQANWDAAQAGLIKLTSQELDNSRTIARIRRLATALRRSNTSSAAVAQSDPKEALAQFDQQIAAIRGDSAAAEWSVDKAPPQPTLSAIKQQVSTLEGDISRRQTQIQSLQKQRDQLNLQADKLSQQADAEQGRRAVDDYNKSSDLRKQASDVQRQIDLANSQLTPQQQNLALAKIQLQATQDAISRLEQEKAALAAQWEALQKQIQSQRQSAATFVQAGADNQDTITAQLDVLSKATAATDALRQQVLDQLTQASTQFTAAANAAQQLLNQLRTNQSPNGPSQAQQTLQTVISPEAYQLQKAAVLQTYAQTKASQAYSLQKLVDLAAFLNPIIQKASLTPPADLAALAAQEANAKTARADADKSFTEADQLLKQLENSSSKNTATILHILTLYDWSNLAAASGDAQNASARLQAAKAMAENAARNNVPLPALPPQVAPAPAPAAAPTPPATQPA